MTQHRQELVNWITEGCSLTANDLADLSDDELSRIAAVDLNWCDDFDPTYYDSAEEAQSLAIFAMFEQIVTEKEKS